MTPHCCPFVPWIIALAAIVAYHAFPSSYAAEPASKRRPAAAQPALTFPPVLPEGASVLTDRSDDFLQRPASLREGVKVAAQAPTIDFLLFPGQDYPGKPWSAWGDSLAANGKYYASIGDHLAPGGNAFVYEYDPASKKMRRLLEVKKLLGLPEGHYTPGKLHSRIDLGSDGWLYAATHRGSRRATSDAFHYRGDWIVRCHPGTGESEIVAHAPVPKHAIPCSVLDGQRMIFYGGTAPGTDAEAKEIQFFAFDVRNRKLLYSGPNGPSRAMILAESTGRLYFTAGKEEAPLMRYDPAAGGPPVEIPGKIGIRAATDETKDGLVYTVSQGRNGNEAFIYAFNTRTEQILELGSAAAGTQSYIASLDADPSGRYLYYVPGAHGGSEADGSAVVRFDVKTREKTVVAFLHPFYAKRYGFTLKGTYSCAVDPAGDKLYITWNASRGSRAWDSCALTVIHLAQGK